MISWLKIILAENDQNGRIRKQMCLHEKTYNLTRNQKKKKNHCLWNINTEIKLSNLSKQQTIENITLKQKDSSRKETQRP